MDRPSEQARILWRITWEADRASKLAQLEAFAAEFPKDEAIGWVYEQTYSILSDTKQFDRALAVGAKLLVLDPDDVETAYKSLKLAEEKKDPELIRKWSQIATGAAERAVASPQAAEGRKELAGQVRTYTEYLAYTEILQTTNRAKKLEMTEEFLKNNGHSPYARAARSLYLATWREADPQKALAIAEKMVEKDQGVEDALILVAENYLQKERAPEQATQYAEKLLALLDQAAKPEGIPDAEWSKKKAVLSVRAHWLIGSVAMQQGRYSQGDRSIRAALPYLRSDTRLTSTALFHLGWANYKLGNVAEAIRFTQECARFKGPYQEQAAKNLAVIRSENPSLQ